MKKKKIALLVLPLIALSLLLANCDESCSEPDEPKHETTLTLSPQSAQLKVGQTLQLTATVEPKTKQSVHFSTSNNNIATVNENGLVTAVAEGTATIKATVNNSEATATITVIKNEGEQYALALSPQNAELKEGETLQLTATFVPPITTPQTITYTSSDTNVATVSNEGLVTAIKAGEAVIKASAMNLEATCSVKVVAQTPQNDFEISNIRITSTNIIADITPRDPNMRYYCEVINMWNYKKIVEKSGDMAKANIDFWYNAVANKDPEKFKKAILINTVSGKQTLNHRTDPDFPLPDNHEAVLVVYGLDPDSGEAITHIDIITLKTEARKPVSPELSFDTEVTNITNTKATFVVKPTNKNATYWWDVLPWENIEFYTNPSPEFEIIEEVKSTEYMLFDLVRQTYRIKKQASQIKKGDQTIQLPSNVNLKPNTEYGLILFGWDETYSITSKPKFVKFKTAE